MADFIVICLLILAGLIMLAPVALIVFGIIKKKRRLVVVTIIVTLAVALLAAAYCILFPTAFPYVDLWVYGKTSEQVSSVYGEPDYIRETGGVIGYKLGKDNGFFGAMDSNNYYYYYIYFDESNTAYKVTKQIQFGG